jgi:hypothetical protein
VLVGNAAGFVPQLKGLGFERYELVTLRDLDLTSAHLHGAAPTRSGPGVSMRVSP